MEISVKLGPADQIISSFNSFNVIADEAKGEYPEAFDYFLASLAMCAGYYVRAFCRSRNISTEGLEIIQNDIKDEQNPDKRTFKLKIKLPKDFPEKYHKAVIASAGRCTVKRVIVNGPEFEIEVE